ncbi:hypothetical protein GIY23_15220 [Allosaccharopolyspora coralli]|uniref:Uncharacterized protein n=1 Tax=Allosaccharopolyspora coralli TaxID=2665642 RepID=A0A5Q3QGM6_9PSEU|nr:hypothetical protein [Allosaccharopolyspora coralli]QGK70685.1 hypothetical protein GIY23_15220 [Allosaccharopolyspora coralli]
MGTTESWSVQELPQPCDEWADLVRAASAAGRWAARELARRCPSRYLDRGGEVAVRVEPVDSPVAAWMEVDGLGGRSSDGSGVVIPIRVTADDLRPAEEAASKAESLLVRYAYAAAYCSVLAEQAGVAADIRFTSHERSARPPEQRMPVTSDAPAAPPGRPSSPARSEHLVAEPDL